MPDTPLNQDALTRRDIMAGLIGAWIDEWDDGKADTGHVATHIANRLAENGVTTLAVAQPEMNSVEVIRRLRRAMNGKYSSFDETYTIPRRDLEYLVLDLQGNNPFTEEKP